MPHRCHVRRRTRRTGLRCCAAALPLGSFSGSAPAHSFASLPRFEREVGASDGGWWDCWCGAGPEGRCEAGLPERSGGGCGSHGCLGGGRTAPACEGHGCWAQQQSCLPVGGVRRPTQSSLAVGPVRRALWGAAPCPQAWVSRRSAAGCCGYAGACGAGRGTHSTSGSASWGRWDTAPGSCLEWDSGKHRRGLPLGWGAAPWGNPRRGW
mmetsp:Transcript_71768/g.126388  ORF Transcript_71768/g.126388 Transcript_71768/m.126388 type:complete len:209 (+) Transcript_71768:772-1398(+)